MRTALGSVVVVLLLVLGGGTAEARRGGGLVIINIGEDILHVRDLDPDHAAEVGYAKLGYKHSHFGLFWFDFWRWDGEFVVYTDDTYAPIDAEILGVLGGGSVPWQYRLPEGLLLVGFGIAFAVLRRRRLDVRQTAITAGVHAALAALLYLLGLTWEVLIPLGFGAYYGLAAWSAYRRGDDLPVQAAPDLADPEGGVVDRPELYAVAAHPAPPPDDLDDLADLGDRRPVVIAAADVPRAPARGAARNQPSQPLAVIRPEPAPIAVPIVHDASVDGPKLLR